MIKFIDSLLARVPFFWLLFIGFGLLYVIIHLANLTALPVFADEAIYIRWAQLLIDDPKQYFLFALNDGKTPLFIWLLAPVQFLFHDKLYAGRVLSVWIGLGQLLLLMELARQLTQRKLGVMLAGLFASIIPFWFFYHRMALMDGLLTVLLSCAVLVTIHLMRQPIEYVESSKQDDGNWVVRIWQVIIISLSELRNMQILRLVALLGLSFGLALLTKLPAILCLPVFFVWIFYPSELTVMQRVTLLVRVGLGVFVGMCLFVLLKLHPAFSQLFSRGSDFLYPFSEILWHGGWVHSLTQIPRYFNYLIGNLSAPLLLFSFLPLFFAKTRRQGFVLTASWVVFLAPMWLFGKVVYPRYFLPSAIFITLAAVQGFILAQDQWVKKSKTLWSQVVAALIIASSVATVAQVSIGFIGANLFFPDRTPFIYDDRTQYLTEWSSGHGITEVVSMIKAATAQGKISVATEGYFGTLPDGLLMYFHRQNVDNVYIEGIGQPVREIPDSFWQKAAESQQVWLVVNSHRLIMKLDSELLLTEHCRPYNGPCLQVWDITSLRDSAQIDTATP